MESGDIKKSVTKEQSDVHGPLFDGEGHKRAPGVTGYSAENRDTLMENTGQERAPGVSGYSAETRNTLMENTGQERAPGVSGYSAETRNTLMENTGQEALPLSLWLTCHLMFPSKQDVKNKPQKTRGVGVRRPADGQDKAAQSSDPESPALTPPAECKAQFTVRHILTGSWLIRKNSEEETPEFMDLHL
ncbi:hypothetical protein TREES_T100017918 [Tupaia chinensis]|uniref:Uncharacterized protein n=1 Tax=Tupaia chinensis TaxID=246437 RepID=L9JRA4_TUPCH|nr:hypothetical protein TREES_T100017918 [Tupaia chinensis]